MTLDLLPGGRRDLLHLLGQAVIWRSYGDESRLVTLYLDAMGTRHQRRVLAWLREHARMLRDFYADDLTQQQRMGKLELEEWGALLAALDATSPEVWLEEQPLVRRLVQLTPRPPALPARRLFIANPRRWWR